jgi:hypothetical protein
MFYFSFFLILFLNNHITKMSDTLQTMIARNSVGQASGVTRSFRAPVGHYITGFDIIPGASKKQIYQITNVYTGPMTRLNNPVYNRHVLNWGTFKNNTKSFRVPPGKTIGSVQIWTYHNYHVFYMRFHYWNMSGANGSADFGPTQYKTAYNYAGGKGWALTGLDTYIDGVVRKIPNMYFTNMEPYFTAESNIPKQLDCCSGRTNTDFCPTYLPQSNQCDLLMTNYCTKSNTDEICSCFTSDLNESKLPVICFDNKCVSSGYRTKQNADFLNTRSCPAYVKCDQILQLSNAQKNIISDTKLQQNCSSNTYVQPPKPILTSPNPYTPPPPPDSYTPPPPPDSYTPPPPPDSYTPPPPPDSYTPPPPPNPYTPPPPPNPYIVNNTTKILDVSNDTDTDITFIDKVKASKKYQLIILLVLVLVIYFGLYISLSNNTSGQSDQSDQSGQSGQSGQS